MSLATALTRRGTSQEAPTRVSLIKCSLQHEDSLVQGQALHLRRHETTQGLLIRDAQDMAPRLRKYRGRKGRPKIDRNNAKEASSSESTAGAMNHSLLDMARTEALTVSF